MGMVQVILSEDVHALGDAGDIVSVKPGYARNYLIPQGKAMIATAERVNEVEHQKRVINEKIAKEFSDLNAVKEKLHGMKLETVAQAGEEGSSSVRSPPRTRRADRRAGARDRQAQDPARRADQDGRRAHLNVRLRRT